MSYVIVNTESGRIVSESPFPTERGAKISLARKWPELATKKQMNFEDLRVMHLDVYNVGFRKTVTVTNLMSGKPVEIDINDRGGVCDPSTESYWSM